jgi:hypothetical protein
MSKNCCNYYLGAQLTDEGVVIYGWAKLDTANSSVVIKWLKEDGTAYTGQVIFATKGSFPQSLGCCYDVSIMCAADGSGPIIVFTRISQGGISQFKFLPDGTIYDEGIVSCIGNEFAVGISIPNQSFGFETSIGGTIVVPGVTPANYYVFSYVPDTAFPSEIHITAFVSAVGTVSYIIHNLSGIDPGSFTFVILLKQV